MFGNKVLLKWKDPRRAYKHEKKQISWKQWLIVIGKFLGKFALAGLFIGVSVQLLSPGKIPYLSLDIFLDVLWFVGMLTAIGTILLFSGLVKDSASSEVSMREKDIIIGSFENFTNIPYKRIKSCSFVKNRIEDQEFDILEIKTWDGNEAVVEIDPNIKIEDINEILKSKNVQIKTPLFNSI